MAAPIVFCSDADIAVDYVIAACRKKKDSSLPTFGRDLVPYFVPGAVGLNEGDVNIGTDVDGLRRHGGSVLDIPKPVASREKHLPRNMNSSRQHTVSVREESQVTQAKKKNSSKRKFNKSINAVSSENCLALAATSARRSLFNENKSPETGSLISPSEKRVGIAAIQTDFAVSNLCNHLQSGFTDALSKASSHSPDTQSPERKGREAWAGSSFSNSPPPSSVPVPQFIKSLQHAGSLELPKVSLRTISKSEPSSPMKSFHQSSAIDSDVLSASEELRKILNINPTPLCKARLSHEHNATSVLKRMLQVA